MRSANSMLIRPRLPAIDTLTFVSRNSAKRFSSSNKPAGRNVVVPLLLVLAYRLRELHFSLHLQLLVLTSRPSQQVLQVLPSQNLKCSPTTLWRGRLSGGHLPNSPALLQAVTTSAMRLSLRRGWTVPQRGASSFAICCQASPATSLHRSRWPFPP